MGKGKKFGGLGLGFVLSTVAGLLIAKKKNSIFEAVQKSRGSFSAILKLLTSCITEQNRKEVT